MTSYLQGNDVIFLVSTRLFTCSGRVAGIIVIIQERSSYLIRNPGEYSECENTSRGGFVKRIAPITRYEFRRYLQAY